MDTLNISRERLDNLTTYNKGGFEWCILLYNENLLLKHFFPHLQGIMDLDNKMYKLKRFQERNISDNIITGPKMLLTVDGSFEGYAMKKMPDAVTIDSVKSLDKLLLLYTKLFNKLDFLHKNNIVIGDIKRENIIVNNNDNPIFVDVDSMGIDELPIDNIGHIPIEGKNIPNIREKYNINDLKAIDKILLLGCFVCSLSQERKSMNLKILQSNLSNEAKKIISNYLVEDKIDYQINFSKFLSDERKKR